MHAVRKATKDDIPALKGILARAFEDDPVTTWMLGSDPGDLARFYEIYELRPRLAETYTTEDLSGAAIWTAPGKWKMPLLTTLRMGPTMLRLQKQGLRVGIKVERLLDAGHPKEPHWYLAVLGTDPAKQGMGVGSAVLKPILDRCDREGIGAYLESSKQENVPFYRRHGFDVTSEVHLPKEGPTLWLMWRDPQPAST